MKAAVFLGVLAPAATAAASPPDTNALAVALAASTPGARDLRLRVEGVRLETPGDARLLRPGPGGSYTIEGHRGAPAVTVAPVPGGYRIIDRSGSRFVRAVPGGYIVEAAPGAPALSVQTAPGGYRVQAQQDRAAGIRAASRW